MATAVRSRKAKALADAHPWPLVLRVRPALNLTEEQFFRLCQLNRDLWIERTAEGDWSIMTPVGGGTSDRNSEVNMQLRLWAKRDGTGVAYDSSGGFRLPNTAIRAPDASWLLKERLTRIPAAQREKFIPLCPDFVLELWSPSDRLRTVQTKMAEYLENGARLGWLIYPPARRVYVYRPDAPVERLERPEHLSGDSVLPGFTLDLREIW